jgi:hypothetical protein
MNEESLPFTSLYEALGELPDPRRAQGKRYELALILSLLVLAKLAGQTSLSGATQWLRHRSASLAERFGLRRKRMLCQMTYCNILAAIDARRLDEIISEYLHEQLPPASPPMRVLDHIVEILTVIDEQLLLNDIFHYLLARGYQPKGTTDSSKQYVLSLLKKHAVFSGSSWRLAETDAPAMLSLT